MKAIKVIGTILTLPYYVVVGAIQLFKQLSEYSSRKR